jgi:DNA-binding NtrC family response regulator
MEKKILNVLILEDDFLLRECLVDAFRDKGFLATGADCASKAMRFLDLLLWDVGIIDLSLPDKRGDEFILEAARVQSEMKFMIYTGNKNYELSPDLMELGMTSGDVFFKPESESTLINSARKLCG